MVEENKSLVKDRPNKKEEFGFIKPARDIEPAPPLIRGVTESIHPEEVGQYLPTLGDNKKLQALQSIVNNKQIPDEKLIIDFETGSLWGFNPKTSQYEKVGGEGNPLDAYPIGSIYMSVVNNSPANIFGGTWVAWGQGRVAVGVSVGETEFNSVEKTGGEKTHTLTENEMPSHNHPPNGGTDFIRYGASNANGNWTPGGNNLIGGAGTVTGNRGGSQAHNNLQPFITCHMWKRTH